MVAYENSGEGAVVMTNAQGGGALAIEIMRSIAVEYGWPDYRPRVLARFLIYLKIFVILAVGIGIGVFLKRVRRRDSVPERSA